MLRRAIFLTVAVCAADMFGAKVVHKMHIHLECVLFCLVWVGEMRTRNRKNAYKMGSIQRTAAILCYRVL